MRSFGDGLAALLGWKASLVGFGGIIGAMWTRSGTFAVVFQELHRGSAEEGALDSLGIRSATFNRWVVDEGEKVPPQLVYAMHFSPSAQPSPCTFSTFAKEANSVLLCMQSCCLNTDLNQ